ncbi:hypothetical protein P153DRAFT_371240 [Dothidotthia symphoricarpi CBS 119687]|uniref:Uncharacterized protein n=1 Tax=Dothidotthia symphoricarpi CBS 119687 TaxID=1392245 RepID=A0A6A5ZWF5_9PLEO|nr:uncharacterized protein P153DRAFT_371240 [Dothidotthia symphoricarpi CBS 119687]KAF2123920.1 hypothetical protein P153DRAFT_371240 [Dothidotthia symphoricarpi CBS 119687]
MAISIMVNGREEIRYGVVLFDPQCEEDIVSSDFATKLDPQLRFSAGIPFATTILGGIIESIGELDARWAPASIQTGRQSLRSPNFRSRFEESHCYIVQSDHFDFIVGAKTIDRLHLFESRNPMVAAFRGLSHESNADIISQEQKDADERRKKAKEESLRYRQQKLQNKPRSPP